MASEAAREQHDRHAADSAPTAVVERLLDRLRVTDSDGAAELLAVDVEFRNTGLPTVRGRERVRKLFRALVRIWCFLRILLWGTLEKTNATLLIH